MAASVTAALLRTVTDLTRHKRMNPTVSMSADTVMMKIMKNFLHKIFPVEDLIIFVFMASFPSDAVDASGSIFKFFPHIRVLRRVYAEKSIFFQKFADLFAGEEKKVLIDIVGSCGFCECTDCI